MTETHDADKPNEVIEQPIESVGDILRKERITRRIAVETIAKDLRLNVKYIKSIESNQYHELPADPYVRVYLRSIAKYLLLSPEEILKKYYAQQGIVQEKSPRDNLTRSLLQPETTPISDKPPLSWQLIVAIIVGILILLIVAGKMGCITTSAPDQTGSAGQDTVKNAFAADPMADSIAAKNAAAAAGEVRADSVRKDSLAKATAAVVPVAKPVPPPVSSGLITAGNKLSLVIKVPKDSVWVQVFSDGVSWKKTLHGPTSKYFEAKDSLNVHVGNNGVVEYVVNGKMFRDYSDKGIAIFKLAPNTPPVRWNLETWKSVFANRM